MKFISRGLLVLSLILLNLAACGKKERQGTALDTAIVSGADLAGRIDYTGIWKAPVLETLRKIRAEKDPERARLDEERARMIEEATGISREDLTGILFSADLDSVNLSSSDQAEEVRRLRAAMAATFSRKITLEQIEAALQIFSEEGTDSVVQREELEGRTVITVSEVEGAEPLIFAARSGGGDTVFITPNTASLLELLNRESEGRTEALPAAMTVLDHHLPEGSQFFASVVVPGALRRKIDSGISDMQQQASRNPGMSVALSFLAPFKNIAGLSVGSRFDKGLEIGVAADLASEEEALQAGTILQTMLLPLLKAKIAQKTAVDTQSLEEMVFVGSSASILGLSLKLQESDLQAFSL